jgi:hypothetical protein
MIYPEFTLKASWLRRLPAGDQVRSPALKPFYSKHFAFADKSKAATIFFRQPA